jgi:hypothetical protein
VFPLLCLYLYFFPSLIIKTDFSQKNWLDGSDWCPPNWAAHTPAQFWWQRLSVTLHHANADTVIYLARELVRLHGPARRGL